MFVKPYTVVSVHVCVLNYIHTHTCTHAVAIEWAQVDMRSTIATIKIDICIKAHTYRDTHTHTQASCTATSSRQSNWFKNSRVK